MKRFILSDRSFAKAKLQATGLWLAAVIIAMAFTACSKKSETAATVTAESYAKILSGDLSDFAGTWVDGYGTRSQLRADGVFTSGSMSNLNADGFSKYDYGAYVWNVSDTGGYGGFGVMVYPPGVPINLFYMDGGVRKIAQTIETDITKVRITAGQDGPSSSAEVYYREGEAPAAHHADEHEGGPGDDYEALPPGFGYPYTAILEGDLSEFAGKWVNNHGGGSVVLTKDGLLQDIGYSVSNFRRIDNAYSWDLSTGIVSMPVFLFPAGVEVTDDDNRHVQTDTTKDRIAIDRCYSNQVYYREGEAQAALEHEELRVGSSVTGVVGRDWKERYNIRSVDSFYISLVIESEVDILLDVYNGQQFIKSSIDDSGEYHSRFEIAAQPNTVYLLEVSSYVRDVTEASFRITAHLSQ